MVETTLFQNNRTQAVRLPKDVAFPESVKRVEVIEVGQARLITPAGTAWDAFFEGPGVTEDFMSERQQPEMQQREGF